MMELKDFSYGIIHYFVMLGRRTTPNPGCLTMVMGDLIFTGDSYIPGVKVSTQLPGGDKKLAQQSLDRILWLAEGKTVYSGHLV